jgi:hypothetical protein
VCVCYVCGFIYLYKDDPKEALIAGKLAAKLAMQVGGYVEGGRSEEVDK